MQKTLDYYLLNLATGVRIGITLPHQSVQSTFADLPGYFNVSISEDLTKFWRTASGSMANNMASAVMGAIGEAMERYSAAVVDFPIKKAIEIENLKEKIITAKEFSLFSRAQHEDVSLGLKSTEDKDAYYGEVYSLYDNSKAWVPQEMIGLGARKEPALIASTSTGLAAHTNKYRAILLALQEVLERDALATTWLNSLGGREIKLDEKYTQPIQEKYGQVYCLDMTQDWNPHPVVAVCGYIPQRNKKRISMGVACRETYAKAIEKAYTEWMQGTIFAGLYDVYHPDLELKKTEDVGGFDEHAVYYTVYPSKWNKVPLLEKRVPHIPEAQEDHSSDVKENIANLLKELSKQNIRIYYRDISLPDVKEAGLTVVRVLSPEMSLLHGDERRPFLGGRTADVAWRYRNIKRTNEKFPNPYPHPLG